MQHTFHRQVSLEGRFSLILDILDDSSNVLLRNYFYDVGVAEINPPDMNQYIVDNVYPAATALLAVPAVTMKEGAISPIDEGIMEDKQAVKWVVIQFIRDNPTSVMSDLTTHIQTDYDWQFDHLVSRLVFDYWKNGYDQGYIATEATDLASAYVALRDFVLSVTDEQLEGIL
jgi:hypothetical protein